MSNVVREPATMRFIHSRSDPFSNSPTWSGHYALSASRTVVLALFIVSLHCISLPPPHSLLSLSFSFPPSRLSTSLADFEFIAPKRRLHAMYYSFVHYAQISLRGVRAWRWVRAMRACVRTQRNATQRTSSRLGRFLIWNLLYSRRERSIESPRGARPLFGHFHCVAAYITTRPLFPAFSTRDILCDPLYTRDTWRFRLFHAAHARI